MKMFKIFIKILLKFVPKGAIDSKSALLQVTAKTHDNQLTHCGLVTP